MRSRTILFIAVVVVGFVWWLLKDSPEPSESPTPAPHAEKQSEPSKIKQVIPEAAKAV